MHFLYLITNRFYIQEAKPAAEIQSSYKLSLNSKTAKKLVLEELKGIILNYSDYTLEKFWELTLNL